MDVFNQKNGRHTYNQQTWKCVSNKTEPQIDRTDGLGTHTTLIFGNNHLYGTIEFLLN